jgi:hypothetical protein
LDASAAPSSLDEGDGHRRTREHDGSVDHQRSNVDHASSKTRLARGQLGEQLSEPRARTFRSPLEHLHLFVRHDRHVA